MKYYYCWIDINLQNLNTFPLMFSLWLFMMSFAVLLYTLLFPKDLFLFSKLHIETKWTVAECFTGQSDNLILSGWNKLHSHASCYAGLVSYELLFTHFTSLYSLLGLRAPLHRFGCGMSTGAQDWGLAGPCTRPKPLAAGTLCSCFCRCRSKAACPSLSTTCFSTECSPGCLGSLEQREGDENGRFCGSF